MCGKHDINKVRLRRLSLHEIVRLRDIARTDYQLSAIPSSMTSQIQVQDELRDLVQSRLNKITLFELDYEPAENDVSGSLCGKVRQRYRFDQRMVS